MATYRFNQFNIDLVDPTMTVVAARYEIGAATGCVEVVLTTPDAELRGVTFNGFPNEGEWSDADVMAWAVLELEKYRVEIP
jgi:hypothetical protein